MFGTGDRLLFWGLSFLACLPQLIQLSGHRSVPESQVVSRLSCVPVTYELNDQARRG